MIAPFLQVQGTVRPQKTCSAGDLPLEVVEVCHLVTDEREVGQHGREVQIPPGIAGGSGPDLQMKT